MISNRLSKLFIATNFDVFEKITGFKYKKDLLALIKKEKNWKKIL